MNIRSGEDNVQELLARRHSGNVFPLGLHFGDLVKVVVAEVPAKCQKVGPYR